MEERLLNFLVCGLLIFPYFATTDSDFAAGNISVVSISSNFSNNEHIYETREGEHIEIEICARWTNDPERPICLWVDRETLPEGANVTPDPATGWGEVCCILSWSPVFGQAGIYNVTFYVGESYQVASGTHIVTIIVHPENISPTVIIEYPENGTIFTEPNITIVGSVEDNAGITQFGYTQEWDGGGIGSSWPLEDEPTYYPFEIPITLRDGWNRIKVYAIDSAGNNGSDDVIYTYSPFVKVNLTIYDGLKGAGGGQVVPEDKEETEGAFTVNNIQDTNGDGIIDMNQHPVKKVHPKGRDEVDLMKMVLHKPVGPGVKPDDPVTLILAGPNKNAVRLWTDSVKTQEILPRGGPWTYKVKDLPKTVWVEIAEKDPTKLKFKGITFTLRWFGNSDTVCATGIWAKVTGVLHDDSDPTTPCGHPLDTNNLIPEGWEDIFERDKNGRFINNFIYAAINFHGGYGVRPLTRPDPNGVRWWRNLIVIQFTVYPKDVWKISRIKFDIARQMKCFDRIRPRYVTSIQDRFIDWPDKWRPIRWPRTELPNDDPPNEGDESLCLSREGHMYVVDAPGFKHVIYNDKRDWPNWRNRIYFGGLFSTSNFNEFMRVRLDGVRPSGNRVDGSRCSDYYKWHCAFCLVPDPNNIPFLKRWPDDKESCREPFGHWNCIGPGHIEKFNPWRPLNLKKMKS